MTTKTLQIYLYIGVDQLYGKSFENIYFTNVSFVYK